MTDITDTTAQTESERASRAQARAERKALNRAKIDAAKMREAARAEVPLPFRKHPEKQPAPGETPESGLLTAKERRQHLQLTTKQPPAVKGEPGRPKKGDDRPRPARSPRGNPSGRPSEYTEEEADTICAWLAEGGSMRAYCRSTGRPMLTIYGWMRENASFLTLVNRACEDRADTLGDEGLEIVDAAAIEPSIEGVAAAKLQWEARKWISAKLRPQKWGDKQVVEHVGAVNIRIGVPQRPALEVVEEVNPGTLCLDDGST